MKNLKRQSVVVIGGLLLAMNAGAAFSSTTHATALIDWSSLKIRTLGDEGANPRYTLTGLNSSSSTNTSDWLNWSAVTSTSGRKFGASVSGDDVGNGSASAQRSANLTISGSGFLMMSAKYSLDAAIDGLSSNCSLWYCDANDASASVSFYLINTSSSGHASHAQKSINLSPWGSSLTEDHKEGTLRVGVVVSDGDILSFSSVVSAYAREVLSTAGENSSNGSGDILLTSSGSTNVTGGSVVTRVNFPNSITLLPVSAAVTAAPLPGAVWMFGSALLGLIGFGRQRRAMAA